MLFFDGATSGDCLLRWPEAECPFGYLCGRFACRFFRKVLPAFAGSDFVVITQSFADACMHDALMHFHFMWANGSQTSRSEIT